MKPNDLILRCYGFKDKRGKWYGNCIDLNIAAEADTANELKSKLSSMICSYIETVYDTEDKESIPILLHRPAPLSDWMCYYCIVACNYISKLPPNRMAFNEAMPLTFAHSC